MDPIELTIAGAAAAIQSKELSPVELAKAYLNRIDRYEGKLNTYITVTGERALEQAQESEARQMRGELLGPLDGIPISVKDIIAYKNVPMTNGSRTRPEQLPEEDATVTRRLLSAGAVILGKAHLHEYAYRGPHPYYGWTRNPWNLERVPGGSSSGSGSSVQARLALASIGTDTGGSIRLPAGLCGVVGLKPTYGRVSRHGVSPLSWSLDHIGPLSRTCEDAGYVLQAIAGYDPADDASLIQEDWSMDSFAKRERLDGLRVGVPVNFFFDGIHPDVETAVRRAAKQLESLGAELIDVRLPDMEAMRSAHRIILNAEAYAFHRRMLEEQGENYGPRLRLSFELGQFIRAEDYIQAQRLRTKLKEDFADIYRKMDILVMPTMPEPAATIARTEQEPSFVIGNFTSLANYLGLPALSLPCGFASDGMPVGFQLMGRPLEEGLILSIGAAYEKATNWPEVRPDESKWSA